MQKLSHHNFILAALTPVGSLSPLRLELCGRMHGLGPCPKSIKFICCAQFAVSKERIQGRPLEFYKKALWYIANNDLPRTNQANHRYVRAPFLLNIGCHGAALAGSTALATTPCCVGPAGTMHGHDLEVQLSRSSCSLWEAGLVDSQVHLLCPGCSTPCLREVGCWLQVVGDVFSMMYGMIFGEPAHHIPKPDCDIFFCPGSASSI